MPIPEHLLGRQHKIAGEKCDICGGEWFEVVELHRVGGSGYSSAPGGHYQNIELTPVNAVRCLCGAPKARKASGVPGPSAKAEIDSFHLSLDLATKQFVTTTPVEPIASVKGMVSTGDQRWQELEGRMNEIIKAYNELLESHQELQKKVEGRSQDGPEHADPRKKDVKKVPAEG